jgi:hypothetical protein
MAGTWQQIAWLAHDAISACSCIDTNVTTGFAAETAPFIAEAGEDENDHVVRQAHQLKDSVEQVAGKIDGL